MIEKYEIDSDDLKRIQWMLLDAIQLHDELETLVKNIEFAAKEGFPARHLLAVKPRPVDLDVSETASMVQVLSVLTAAKAA